MKNIIATVALIVVISVLIAYWTKKGRDSQELIQSSGLIYGADVGYLLTAPEGWHMDNKSGNPMGLPVIFYPQGQTLESTKTTIYSVAAKYSRGESFADFLKRDADAFKKQYPGISVIEVEEIHISNNDQIRTAAVRNFFNERDSRYEAVAYIDEAKAVPIVVLNSKSKKDFEYWINLCLDFNDKAKISPKKKKKV